MYIKRSLKNDLVETLEYAPVVLVNGARQSGKSTFVKELMEEGRLKDYVTMNNPSILSKISQALLIF